MDRPKLVLSNTRLAESAQLTMSKPARNWTTGDLDMIRSFVTEHAAGMLDHLLVLRIQRECFGATRNAKVKARAKREVRVTVELL